MRGAEGALVLSGACDASSMLSTEDEAMESESEAS